MVKNLLQAISIIAADVEACLAAEKSDPPKPAQSTDELRQQLEKILKDTHTNGLRWRLFVKTDPSG